MIRQRAGERGTFWAVLSLGGNVLIDDRDIWRTAHTLIEQYCEHAAMRSDELLAAGDIEGRDVWLRVLGAIGRRCRSPLQSLPPCPPKPSVPPIRATRALIAGSVAGRRASSLRCAMPCAGVSGISAITARSPLASMSYSSRSR